jgi:hypothetical protein
MDVGHSREIQAKNRIGGDQDADLAAEFARASAARWTLPPDRAVIGASGPGVLTFMSATIRNSIRASTPVATTAICAIC